ncbi:MAG: M81 family metallopeptidase [Gammaproteobacteria bacterium]|nr:M81 family metallopeptidase [Gammaproteobacteria bacterium]
MARIAVGGWQHETNTFAPIKADYAAFERPGGWPAMSRGEAMFDALEGVHVPAAGAIEALDRAGHHLLPLLWCAATPCAHVTRDAFERISATFLGDVEAAMPLDGIYLDLHGAMVCEHLEDGEGEFLARLRELVGAELPIAVSLDLHANVTAAMVEHASVIDVYRTYPHVDMGETGARTATHLDALLKSGERWHAALRHSDFLVPLNWGCTLVEPARSIYAALPDVVGGEVAAAALAMGFPLADIAEAGPAALAYARTQRAADDAAELLIRAVGEREQDFAGRVWSPADAVAEARRLLERGGTGPVVLADSQDNPGGGGPGDTTGLLRALVEGGAEGAVFGLVRDPDAAAAAHAAGIGATLELALGERSRLPGHEPYRAQFEVLGLGDGSFTATGPMWHGARMRLGPMALLETGGVRVMVSSKGVQLADRAIMRHLGLEPVEQRIIALKSSVHFRNDFQDIAREILIVAAPGPVYADPGALEFENLRPGVRKRPGG